MLELKEGRPYSNIKADISREEHLGWERLGVGTTTARSSGAIK
jgi:hypothetical protein